MGFFVYETKNLFVYEAKILILILLFLLKFYNFSFVAIQ